MINEWLKSPHILEMEGAMVGSALIFTLNQLIIESIKQSTKSRKNSIFMLEGIIKVFERHIERIKNGD